MTDRKRILIEREKIEEAIDRMIQPRKCSETGDLKRAIRERTEFYAIFDSKDVKYHFGKYGETPDKDSIFAVFRRVSGDLYKGVFSKKGDEEIGKYFR